MDMWMWIVIGDKYMDYRKLDQGKIMGDMEQE